MLRNLTFLVALSATATFSQAQEFDRPEKEACDPTLKDCYAVARGLQQVVRAHGWKCDTVSGIVKFVFSRGFSLWCNGHAYAYEIEDKGGRWVATLK